MFILKLGAEALSIKSGSLKEHSSSSPSSASSLSPVLSLSQNSSHNNSNGHQFFEQTNSNNSCNDNINNNNNNAKLLQTLLTNGLGESALLSIHNSSNHKRHQQLADSDVSPIKRCHSVQNSSKSAFLQALNDNSNSTNSISTTENYWNNNNQTYQRPRSGTLPDQMLLARKHRASKFQTYTNQKRLNKDAVRIDETNDVSDNNYKTGILYQYLSKQNPNSTQLSLVLETGEKTNGQVVKQTNETKLLRRQINCLLKSIMKLINDHLIINNDNNNSFNVNVIFSSSVLSIPSESDRKLLLVSDLWFRIIILLIIQLNDEDCRSFVRLLLLHILTNTCSNINNSNHNKDGIKLEKKDKSDNISMNNIQQQHILLLQKIQDLINKFGWIRNFPDAFNLVLFWLLGKYGYPDLFAISDTSILFQLPNLLSNPTQRDSIIQLMNQLYDLSEEPIRMLLCHHLPSNTSVADFLLQWT